MKIDGVKVEEWKTERKELFRDDKSSRFEISGAEFRTSGFVKRQPAKSASNMLFREAGNDYFKAHILYIPSMRNY